MASRNRQGAGTKLFCVWLVGWLWTKHHILLEPRRYFTSDPPLVELSPCSKDGQGEGEAADIAHQPISQGIEPGTTESVDREQSPEPLAPLFCVCRALPATTGGPTSPRGRHPRTSLLAPVCATVERTGPSAVTDSTGATHHRTTHDVPSPPFDVPCPPSTADAAQRSAHHPIITAAACPADGLGSAQVTGQPDVSTRLTSDLGYLLNLSATRLLRTLR